MEEDRLEEIVAKIEDLSSYKEYLNSLIKPSVDVIIRPGGAENQESRFGGHAFVASNFVWPSHEIGEYRFLGQINFGDIINRPEILPKSGLLSLFYAYDEAGEVFWGDDGYVLGFYWPNIEELELIDFPVTSVPDARKIELIGNIDIPRHEDLRGDWPFDTEILYELLEEEILANDYLLGYPSYYSLAYDPTPGPEWISLLTLSSYDMFDWCWHDGDKLMVFIEKEKLKSNDFSSLKSDAG